MLSVGNGDDIEGKVCLRIGLSHCGRRKGACIRRCGLVVVHGRGTGPVMGECNITGTAANHITCQTRSFVQAVRRVQDALKSNNDLK